MKIKKVMKNEKFKKSLNFESRIKKIIRDVHTRFITLNKTLFCHNTQNKFLMKVSK